MDAAATASAILSPHLVIDKTAIQGAHADGSLNEENVLASFKKAQADLLSEDFDIVVLSDINAVISQGIIPLKDVRELIKEKPLNVEMVLTGPGAPGEIIERADLVTEMKVSCLKEGSPRNQNQTDTGFSTVVTGDGKGKTTYCLGRAMLASCLGSAAGIFQFIKSPHLYGEVKAIAKFPHLKIETMGEGFISLDQGVKNNRRHVEAARRAWELSEKEIYSGSYGLIVLDEVNIATHYELIEVETVRHVLTNRPQNLQLFLSGRSAHPDVMGAASTVIEMKEIKHPFMKGIKARKGIEF
jgi:cob(I)alamin adenosyltransferase